MPPFKVQKDKHCNFDTFLEVPNFDFKDILPFFRADFLQKSKFTASETANNGSF